MKSSRFIATIPVGVLLILGACASPAATPPPTQSRAAPVATTPAPTTPAVTTPAPVAAIAPAAVPALAPAAAQTPAGDVYFIFSDLQVTPVKARPGDTVKIVVKAREANGQSGTSSVTMQVAGDDEACPMIAPQTKNVTLAAGEVKEIVFEVPTGKDLGGAYSVVIGTEKGRMIVE